MYSWIWGRLPGHWPAKLALSTALLAGFLALLWFVAFPVAERRLPFTDVTVTGVTTNGVTTNGVTNGVTTNSTVASTPAP